MQEESWGSALGVSSLRSVASARVDEIPHSDLHGSRNAIGPVMSGLARDGGIAERISRLDGEWSYLIA